MRISFLGSTPIPPTRSQAGTAIMVELGDGRRFFFDFGSGCLRNIFAMQIPLQTVNDIFLTHLHIDHFADLPYLYCFAPWMARWKPLRVHGPSGRTPRDGTSAMIEGMKLMTQWHTDSFNNFPIGDGYEVEVNEFDFRDDNGICYDKDGCTVRHWRRSRTKDDPARPEFVVLEASGVADPASILQTFANPALADHIRLDSILCVVDAEQVFAAPEEMELKLWQIACADMIVLNKIDLVARSQIAAIRAWLDDHFHRYRLVEASHSAVPLEILMAAGRLDARGAEATSSSKHGHHDHDHGCDGDHADHAQTFASLAWESDAPLALADLQQAAARLPVGVYRAKGIVNTLEAPDRRTILQVVGKRVETSLGAHWGDEPRRSRIVAIGAVGAFRPEDLATRFDACRAGHVSLIDIDT